MLVVMKVVAAPTLALRTDMDTIINYNWQRLMVWAHFTISSVATIRQNQMKSNKRGLDCLQANICLPSDNICQDSGRQRARRDRSRSATCLLSVSVFSLDKKSHSYGVA